MDTISAPRRSARSTARLVLPLAVGPVSTRAWVKGDGSIFNVIACADANDMGDGCRECGLQRIRKVGKKIDPKRKLAIHVFPRTQALPGTALPCRLCLPVPRHQRCPEDRAFRTVRS